MPLTTQEFTDILERALDAREAARAAAQPAPQSDWRARFIGDGNGPEIFVPRQNAFHRRRAFDPMANRGSEGRPDDRGMRMAGIVMALAQTHGNVRDAGMLIEQRYHEKDVEIMQRALAAGSNVDGGFLVRGDLADEVIELLRPASVVRSLNPVIMPMPNGTLSVRKLAGGSSASYTGENGDINVTQPQFGDLVLTARKLTAIVPISNDLVRAPSAGAEAVTRDDLVAAMAQRADLAFIRGTGLSNTPKGLRYWTPAANVIPANGTVNLGNVTDDLRDLVNALESANVRMLRPGFIMAPRTKNYLQTVRDGNGNFAFRDEMLRGLLWGFPFRVTTQVPTNLGAGGDESEVYLADFADVVIGEDEGLILDVSTEASYVESGNLVSAYSRDQTVLRSIALHDFGMRHDASVAVLTEVTWGV